MSGLASQIPLALSLLHTVASQYPAFQKSQPTPPTTVVAPPPAPPPPAPPAPAVAASLPQAPAPSAPVPIPSLPPKSHASGSATPANRNAAAPGTSLCDHCHLRPKYVDGNKTHAYCSKTCASQNAMPGTLAVGTPPSYSNNAAASTNCEICHVRPKYVDGNKTHPYCGKACAAKDPSNKPAGSCLAPGCQNPGFVSANGTTMPYCSVAHKTIVETICLFCRKAPKLASSNFCGKPCSDDAEKKGPALLEVPQGHVTFKSVADQFKASWRHAGTHCPPVKHVYKILSTQTSLNAYNTYRASVEAKGQFAASGRSAGNENRRWHGTKRSCLLGDKNNTKLCSSTTCSLCCIIRTSFDLSMWGKKTGWGRFGKGLYTSSTSSKSNDYSHNETKSALKAILLNKVVVGKGYKMTHDNTSLTSPPSGYDSVLAEKGGSLNYDELVVYTNDAIRPSFLVVYEA